MDLELNGKVVIVTGGSDGLGAATAERLLLEGASVCICGRDPDRLARAENRLRQSGDEVLAERADVTVPAEIDRLVSATVGRWGRIDGLVNNAGRSAAFAFPELTDKELNADLDLKLFGAVRMARAALPHLRAARGGAIVNVLATAGKAPPPRSAPTSLSRAGGMALTKVLSKELGADSIRVNAVLVGLIESGQWERRAVARGIPVEGLYDEMAADGSIPLGRVGRAREFADVVAFLLSPRASYLSGTAVNVDGGLSSVV